MSEVKDVMMDVSDAPVRRRGRGRRSRKMVSQVDHIESQVEKVDSKVDSKVQPKIEKAKQAIILAPAPKIPKVLLVPKGIEKKPVKAQRNTYKARKIRVVIDNTAKTQKKRHKVLTDIDAMKDDELRAAAVLAKLSRPETVAKVPIALLKQLMKDYRILRGQLI